MSGLNYQPKILEGVPEHLVHELKQYEDWFFIKSADLKRITDCFVKELEKGLTKEGGNIVRVLKIMPMSIDADIVICYV